MKALTPTELLLRLIGPIDPVADAHLDGLRVRNLADLTTVIDELLSEVRRVAQTKNSEFGSMKACGVFADTHLKGLARELSEGA